MKTQAIIAMAGTGQRLGADVPKPFVLLDNIPLFVYCLKAFEESNRTDSVILVVHPDWVEYAKEAVLNNKINKVKKVVAGAKVRVRSVFNGLQVLDMDTDIVVVHDGVRPFVSFELIDEVISRCYNEDAVVVAVPVKYTVKMVDNNSGRFVKKTLDRTQLWEAQTPQVFKRDILLAAYARFGRQLDVDGGLFTDEACMVEQCGYKVRIVMGEYRNIKITTKEDIVIAESFLHKTE